MMWCRFHDACDAIRMVSRNRYHRPSCASGMGSGAYSGCLQAQADSPLFGRPRLFRSSSLSLFPPPLSPCSPSRFSFSSSPEREETAPALPGNRPLAQASCSLHRLLRWHASRRALLCISGIHLRQATSLCSLLLPALTSIPAACLPSLKLAAFPLSIP